MEGALEPSMFILSLINPYYQLLIDNGLIQNKYTFKNKFSKVCLLNSKNEQCAMGRILVF